MLMSLDDLILVERSLLKSFHVDLLYHGAKPKGKKLKISSSLPRPGSTALKANLKCNKAGNKRTYALEFFLKVPL